MMRILVVILALWAAVSELPAQGYDWEWSPRAPRSMQTRFASVELTGGYAIHQGDLTYLEDQIVCCDFTDGTGLPFRLSVLIEDWFQPSTSFTYGGGVTFQSTSFTSDVQVIPRSDAEPIQRRYQFDASLTYLHLQGGIRQRLFRSGLAVGVELRGLINVAASYTLLDQVVAPDDFTFTTNPPSRERTLTEDVIENTAVFVLEPALSVRYDIPLGIGMVLSPVVQFSVPVLSLAGDASWRYAAVWAGVQLSTGL